MRKDAHIFGVAMGLISCLIAPIASADVTIDRAAKYQSIEGFGIFGAADVWWNPSAVLNNTWSQMVIDDLGITMWRNEYYPTATAAAPQDAQWNVQKPVVQSLYAAANASKVPLKTVLTVWSPPADYKCIVVTNGQPTWGTCATPLVRPTSTKGGNILDPSLVDSFAGWLVAGLQMYKDIGVDVYGLSMQNEPMFWQGYNSCFYEQVQYAQHLSKVGPIIKASFPNVKIFGAENMLGIECGAGANGTNFDPYFYTAAILNTSGALSAIDKFAVHGYVDGVTATATSKLATLWTSFRTATASANKSLWMTETSGYNHTWTGGPCTSDASKTCSGAFDLAQAIYAGLYYGRMTAWVYWQGSGGNKPADLNEYALMAGPNNPGKNYYVSKQYYRYIRPGAQMVDAKSSDPNILAAAFDNTQMGGFTVVAMNTGTAAAPLTLVGNNLPSSYKMIRTSASENAVDLGTVAAGSITLPPSSITTLVSGNYLEAQVPTIDAGAREDSGGNTDLGGASGLDGAAGGGGRGGAGGVSNAGGAIGLGGTTGRGGATGSAGVPGSGGRGGAGGAVGGGGTTARGGATGIGGATARGGATGSGGAIVLGGNAGFGGAIGFGGSSGGRTGNAAGGTIGGGGVGGKGGASTAPPGGASGCSCNVNGGASSSHSGAIFTLVGIAAIIALRRRRK
jgi:glucuronoarabinoxylan endo-1,4-beta-xylanase